MWSKIKILSLVVVISFYQKNEEEFSIYLDYFEKVGYTHENEIYVIFRNLEKIIYSQNRWKGNVKNLII